jgi:hypothetical protein
VLSTTGFRDRPLSHSGTPPKSIQDGVPGGN